jgi:hypothetical protein
MRLSLVTTVEDFPPLEYCHTWFLMASTREKKPTVSTGASSTKEGLTPASNGLVSQPAPGNEIARELEELRDRYRKTTNALGSAAHDLKTPLAILNGYIELLRGEKLGPLNERQREIIADMFSSGQRLQHFIQDFLTYTVLETGELRMQFTEADINDTLSEVCRIWSNRFQEKGVALYFLGNDKLAPFPFDSPKVQRVISNLLENACKYTPQGGTVWLHAEPHMWANRPRMAIGGGNPPALPTRSRSASPIPVPGSGPSSNWKFSMTSSASPAPNRPRAWGWDSPLPAAFCRAWAEKSGWKANWARAANFLS